LGLLLGFLSPSHVREGDDDEGLESGDDDDDDDDDEDVQFVMGGEGTGATASGMKAASSHHRTLMREDDGEEGQDEPMGVIAMQKVTFDEKPSLFEMDLDAMPEKPWRAENAKSSDWFNYGFNEDSWRQYCRKQTRLRTDNQNQGRIEVISGSRNTANSATSDSRRRSRSRSPSSRDGRRPKRSRSREVKRERSRSRDRKRR
jgi:hypothetical protein